MEFLLKLVEFFAFLGKAAIVIGIVDGIISFIVFEVADRGKRHAPFYLAIALLVFIVSVGGAWVLRENFPSLGYRTSAILSGGIVDIIVAIIAIFIWRRGKGDKNEAQSIAPPTAALSMPDSVNASPISPANVDRYDGLKESLDEIKGQCSSVVLYLSPGVDRRGEIAFEWLKSNFPSGDFTRDYPIISQQIVKDLESVLYEIGDLIERAKESILSNENRKKLNNSIMSFFKKVIEPSSKKILAYYDLRQEQDPTGESQDQYEKWKALLARISVQRSTGIDASMLMAEDPAVTTILLQDQGIKKVIRKDHPERFKRITDEDRSRLFRLTVSTIKAPRFLEELYLFGHAGNAIELAWEFSSIDEGEEWFAHPKNHLHIPITSDGKSIPIYVLETLVQLCETIDGFAILDGDERIPIPLIRPEEFAQIWPPPESTPQQGIEVLFKFWDSESQLGSLKFRPSLGIVAINHKSHAVQVTEHLVEEGVDGEWKIANASFNDSPHVKDWEIAGEAHRDYQTSLPRTLQPNERSWVWHCDIWHPKSQKLRGVIIADDERYESKPFMLQQKIPTSILTAKQTFEFWKRFPEPPEGGEKDLENSITASLAPIEMRVQSMKMASSLRRGFVVATITIEVEQGEWGEVQIELSRDNWERSDPFRDVDIRK